MLRRINIAFFVYVTVLGLWIIAIIVKLKFNGLILDLDFGLYHPDGALYTTRALDWSGYTETEAARIVSNWYNINSLKYNQTIPKDLYYANHHLYPEYSTRILYPLFSIPFVKLIGVPGMLVVPALSLLVLMIVVAKIGLVLKKPLITVVVIFLLSSSPTVLRWMLANTTDALLVAIFSLAAYCLFAGIKNRTNFWLINILIISSALTRFSLLFWLVISLVLKFFRLNTKALYIALLSIFVAIPALLSHQSNSFLAVEGNRPFLEKLALFPFYLIKITLFEFGQLFVLDKILFLMCAGSICFSIKCFNKVSSKYLLMMFAAGLLMGTLNGNIGVNFRYQLPVLVFICWSLIDNASPKFENYVKLNRIN